MDPDAELLEPTTPDGSEDGEGPEEAGEAGELDYEPSEPDAASPADLIRYQVRRRFHHRSVTMSFHHWCFRIKKLGGGLT
jgi:hypothetical protein